jgi:apolipoprotein N-acyltransferase
MRPFTAGFAFGPFAGNLPRLVSEFRSKQRIWRAYVAAVGAGLLLAASFPKLSIAGFAWVAPGLMLASAIGCTGKDGFRVGYVAGLSFWLPSLYWLLLIPVTGFPILGWMALSAYLALFHGAWVWLGWRLFPAGRGRAASSVPTAKESSTLSAEDRTPSPRSENILLEFASAPRLSRLNWAFLCAMLWVALELIRSHLLSGFPWSLLGVSQYQMTPLLQISSITGVYGVSFLVAWTSVSLLSASLMLMRPRASRTVLPAEVFPPLLAVGMVFALGYHRVTHAPESERSVRLTLVQPSIAQTVIWDPEFNDSRFNELLTLSENALATRTDVLLWPEAALPELNEASFDAMTNLAVAHKTWFIFGADDVQYPPGATNEDDLIFYNAAWLLSPRGLIADTYHKRRLVMFGEYVPLSDWLPFVKWLTPITGSFKAGANPTQFPLRDAGVNAAPLICFEDVFPHGVRDHVTQDTDLLVNLTNDGWFGESAQQWQHAANAVFRAIENGVPMVRCCNNGLTCWIDPQGRIREIFRDERGTIYGSGFTTFTVQLASAPHQLTFYSRHGDVFGWGCVALASWAVARSWLRRRQ